MMESLLHPPGAAAAAATWATTALLRTWALMRIAWKRHTLAILRDMIAKQDETNATML